MDANVNGSKRIDPHFDTDTADETPAISNTFSEKVCVREEENKSQCIDTQQDQQSDQMQPQCEQTERPIPKKMKELSRSKSNQKDGKFRPISMSQSKRRSISSKRLNVGTLSLLGSLNLIQNNDSDQKADKNDDELLSPIKSQRLKDMNSTVTDKIHETKENSDTLFDNTNQKANDDGPISPYNMVPSPLLVLESIYINAAQAADNFDERSSLLRQDKCHRICEESILEEDHSEVSSPRERSSLKIIKDEPPKLKGLSIEGGILEFCTVTADLSLILNDNNKLEKETKKTSIYDIIDDDNNIDKLEVSSYISPIKGNCLPSEHPFSIEHIANFCFPSGVPIDFVSEETANDATSNSGTPLTIAVTYPKIIFDMHIHLNTFKIYTYTYIDLYRFCIIRDRK
jgi:hypothetical protein